MFPEFSEALKHAYVDVATRQNRTAGIAVTSEGMFLTTGIAAAEAANILHADVLPTSDVDADLPLPRILNAWHTDARFTGPYGVLRDLEFSENSTRQPGQSGTFTDLVHAYFPEISPRVLLDELLRLDLVQEVGNGFYRATRRSYVPDPLSEDMIHLLGQLAHNFLESLEVNARPESKGGKGLLQRFVYADIGLNAGTLRRFDSHLRDRGQTFANDIDDWLTSNQEREENQGRFRTGVGYYHYVVNEDDELDFGHGQSNKGEGK